MSPLQPKGEARAKVGAGEAGEQALHKLLHLQRDERQIAAGQRELAPFAQPYGLSSAECYQRFLVGEMGDRADIIEEMGRYEEGRLYPERLGTIRTATEA